MNILFRKHSIVNLKTISMRKAIVDVIGAFLAMLMAAFVGGYVASIAIRPIQSDLHKFAIGIFIGLLVGMVVGRFVNRMWNRFLKTLDKRTK